MWHERNILVQAARSRTPHIVDMIAALQNGTDLTVLLEYLPAGDLGLLLEERKTIPEAWARFWTAECLQAIFWMHDIGYAHRCVSHSCYARGRSNSPDDEYLGISNRQTCY